MLVQARKGSADCCDEPGLGLGDKGGVGPPWTVRRYLSPHSPGWKSRAGNLRGNREKGLFTSNVVMHLASSRQRRTVEGF